MVRFFRGVVKSSSQYFCVSCHFVFRIYAPDRILFWLTEKFTNSAEESDIRGELFYYDAFLLRRDERYPYGVLYHAKSAPLSDIRDHVSARHLSGNHLFDNNIFGNNCRARPAAFSLLRDSATGTGGYGLAIFRLFEKIGASGLSPRPEPTGI